MRWLLHRFDGKGSRVEVLDRRPERRLIDQLLADVRSGGSRALVVHGEAGIGKTVLLDHLFANATGCAVIRAAGVESEMELAFATLHQVCAPMLERIDYLPEPQRFALQVAFGLAIGNAPDEFLLGLAVLGLFAEASRTRPVVCAVDDAQWLDRASAQVLGFVARRLRAEPVAIVFAVRESGPGGVHSWVPELADLPDLQVAGLPAEVARDLLTAAHPGLVDENVRDRILAEARGNPLALLELPRGFSPSEFTGEFGLSAATGTSHRIEESYRRQVEQLPVETRRLMLVAAVEPTGDSALVRRAAEELGLSVDEAAQPGEVAGLVDFGRRVVFRHPLLRSAVHKAANPPDVRRAHAAVARATDPATDADWLAWHLAQAASGPDEDVASRLERCADRAQARGGLSAAAAFREQAAELTPEPARRSFRALVAAQAKLDAGQAESSLRLLSVAQAGPLDDRREAEAELLKVRIGFTLNRGKDSPSQLLAAAARLGHFDTRRARETYLDAMMAAWFAGHLASGGGLREAAEAALRAPDSPSPSDATDLLLDALAVRFTAGYEAAVSQLSQAMEAFRSAPLTSADGLHILWAVNTALDLWNDEAFDTLSARFLDLARNAGALAIMPLALTVRISWFAFAGDLTAAERLMAERKMVLEATGIAAPSYGPLLFAAWRGGDDAFAAIANARRENARRGEGAGVLASGQMLALLCNGLGRYDEALVAAQDVTDRPIDLGVVTWASLVELITAAARVHRPDIATSAFNRLSASTRLSGTNWALGLEARCRALVSEDGAAEDAYKEAIERLGRTRIRGELARAHLYFGEWLRRNERQSEARVHLRRAYEISVEMGTHALRDHAARELAATGEAVHRHPTESAGKLTPQEAQIARLAGEGLSNAEIGIRLFVSPRTVEWHLSKIFTKLQITSRRQLRPV